MEDQRIIEMLKRRLMEMEMEMNEHQTVIETQCQVSGHVTCVVPMIYSHIGLLLKKWK